MTNFIQNNVLDKSIKGYLSTMIIFLLGGIFIWLGIKNSGFFGICVGVILLVISLAVLILISAMSNERDVNKIIKRDFSPESHNQILAMYEPFRERKAHALFVTILNRAKKDPHEVERLSEIAARNNYDMRAWLDDVGFEER